MQDLAASLLPECRKCFWNFVMEGDVMPSLMTCLPKDDSPTAWQKMLHTIYQNLQQRNIDDEELAEELQSGVLMSSSAAADRGNIPCCM